jgi:hypothetical protein
MRRGWRFLVVAVLLLAAGTAHATNTAEAIPYLKKIQSCNPALGSDCAPRAIDNDNRCAADSDCAMGCLKGDDGGLPRCMAGSQAHRCSGGADVPQKGVSCGCMPDSHSCGFLPLPVK